MQTPPRVFIALSYEVVLLFLVWSRLWLMVCSGSGECPAVIRLGVGATHNARAQTDGRTGRSTATQQEKPHQNGAPGNRTTIKISL